MTTALANTSTPFAGLTPGSRQMAIIEANVAGEPMSEMDLTKVSTPAGGSTTWEVKHQGNKESCDEIVGILVAIGKKGILWPDDEVGTDPPVVSSVDLITGYRTSDVLGSVKPEDLEKYRIGDRRYDWAAMSEGPEFGPKSGKGGVGKRVKESRTIAILRDGDTWPLLVSVGPGSLGTFMPFLKKLPAFHYECVIGIRLVPDVSKAKKPYAVITPRLVSQLSVEQGEFVRKMYTEPMKRAFSALPNGAVAASTHDDE